MTSKQQLHLEDAQKRLATFRKHLDLLARCSDESKIVDANEVLSAVTELQSLVEWVAQQPGLGAESAVLLVKLKELHEIKENLEKNPSESGECSTIELQGAEESKASNPSENYSKDAETTSGTVTPNFDDNNEDNIPEEDSFNLSGDKESLCDFSASTEDPNLANAESPQSIEDTNADIIPNDEKADEVEISDENEYPRPVNEPRGYLDTEGDQQDNLELQKLSKTEISETISRSTDLNSPNLYRSEVIIIETDEDNKAKEWSGDFKNSNDPLDICMYAIRNLYESLRVKENELLKLSTMQNDQKHIEALQAVIIDFHKDKTNLNNQLENVKKENVTLKEQVLELEEAENDARLEAQNLGQKLAFLQEKDSHAQAELTQLKQTVEKNEDMLAEKANVESELRSQMKYMETLVQKYEDQLKELEAKESSCSQRLQQMEQKYTELSSKIQEKKAGCNRGTQTYPPSRTKINSNGEVQADNCGVDNSVNINQSPVVLEECKGVKHILKSEDIDSSLQSSSSAEDIHPKDSVSTNEGCISQNELLNRLHKLIDEDVTLQQQIHHVDQINLTLWKKLQNLDNHIGECKLQNINETDPMVDENEIEDSSKVSSATEPQESSDNITDENIPIENSNCLDQNEKYIHERLKKLEDINASFEKELKTRENICKEKEKKYADWMETENRFIDNLKRLAVERDSLRDQMISIKKEKSKLQKSKVQQEENLKALKQKNQAESMKIKAEEESATEKLNLKVNQLLAKEKEILKMIASLKIEKSKNQDKSELEKLKCGYIELQLELSHYREQIRRIEEQFKVKLEECTGKHLQEENKIVSELERLLNDNINCDKIISDLEIKQQNLLDALEKQEKYLEIARENYKKDLEEADKEHRSIESELKTQLHQIEERTVVAATVLMEERKRVEKELQDNVEDLRVKEKVYKAKIAELEQDVTHLHDELHKIATMSESKADVAALERNTKKQIPDNASAISREKSVTENENVSCQSSAQIPDPISSFKSPHEIIVEYPPSAKKQYLQQMEGAKNKVKEEFDEENVDELRAQVRELQNQLEKISGAEYEMPTVPQTKLLQPVKACLGSQKLEDLDYAEVDYCCLDAWKKIPKYTDSDAVPSNFQGVYDNKHLTGYKEKLKNEGKTAKREPIEENDYDEVLPRPTNFHVVQQVGSDTLLVGWNYVNPSILDGFEVYLGDQVHERIYIPDRTKALISGLNLKNPVHLSICALSRYGQMSEPAVLDLSSPHELHSKYFEDEYDEYRDIEDPSNQKPRPYSMEW